MTPRCRSSWTIFTENTRTANPPPTLYATPSCACSTPTTSTVGRITGLPCSSTPDRKDSALSHWPLALNRLLSTLGSRRKHAVWGKELFLGTFLIRDYPHKSAGRALPSFVSGLPHCPSLT